MKITLGSVWLIVPALVVLIYVGTLVQYPLDLWNHLCVGRLIWDHGSIPGTDPTTFTIPGQAVVYQNWLVEWALYGLYRLGGVELAQMAIAGCYAAAIGLTTALAWLRSRSARVSAGLGLVAVALAVSNFGVRPQALSALLFAAELLVLAQGPGRWWTPLAVGLIELVWTNVHGAFPLGVILPGCFLAGTLGSMLAASRRRDCSNTSRPVFLTRSVRSTKLADTKVAWVYAASLLAAAGLALVNPHPEKTLDYVCGVASRATERQIGEWQSTLEMSFTSLAFFASLPLAAVVAGLRRRQLSAVDWLLLAAFAGLGLTAQRMVIWWALVLPPVLAPQVRGMLAARRMPAEEPSRANFAILVVLLAAAALSTPWTRFYNPLLPAPKRGLYPPDEPRQVVALLAQRDFRGRVFAPLEWGSYLGWHLAPRVQVFLDAWVDFYPDAVWDDYARIGGAESGWEELLEKYQVELVVWNRRLETPLPAALEASQHWQKLLDDDLCVVYQMMKDER